VHSISYRYLNEFYLCVIIYQGIFICTSSTIFTQTQLKPCFSYCYYSIFWLLFFYSQENMTWPLSYWRELCSIIR